MWQRSGEMRQLSPEEISARAAPGRGASRAPREGGRRRPQGSPGGRGAGQNKLTVRLAAAETAHEKCKLGSAVDKARKISIPFQEGGPTGKADFSRMPIVIWLSEPLASPEAPRRPRHARQNQNLRCNFSFGDVETNSNLVFNFQI